MDCNKIEIRKAKYSDIKEIANIKVTGWQNAYRGIVSDEYLNNMVYSKQIEKYTTTYSLDTIFVAEKDNEILGFCRFYNYDTSVYDDLEVDCEIREIYVRPDIKRMGVGSKLFNYTLDYLKKKGKMKLYLGVFKENYNSRKFYEKMGGIIGEEDVLEIENKKYPIISYTYILNERK